MSKRTRLLELMTAAGLAKTDLAREQIKAQRDGANNAQWIGALSSLVPIGADLAGKGIDLANEDAMLKAQQAVAAGGSERGAGTVMTKVGPKGGPEFAESYAQTPEQVAADFVKKDKNLNAPEKSGNIISDFFADPMGINTRAREKASLAAQQGITQSVKTNRAADAANAKQKLSLDWSQLQGKQAADAAVAAREATRADKAAERAARVDEKSADLISREGIAEEARKNALEIAKLRAAATRGRGGAGKSAAEKAQDAADKIRQAEIAKLTGFRNSLDKQVGRLEKSLSDRYGNPLENPSPATLKKIETITKQMDQADARLESLWSVDLPFEAEAPPEAEAEAPAPVAAAKPEKGFFASLFDDDEDEKPAQAPAALPPAKPALPPAGLAGAAGAPKLDPEAAQVMYDGLGADEQEQLDAAHAALVENGTDATEALVKVMESFQALQRPASFRRKPSTLDLPGS